MKLCLAFTVQSIGVAIYNVYFHPLSKFSGPILATATPIPFAYRVFDGRGVDWLQYLHKGTGKWSAFAQMNCLTRNLQLGMTFS